MSNNEILQSIGKLVKTLNSQRVISEGEIQEVLQAIITILASNKQQIDDLVKELDSDTKAKLEEAKDYLIGEHQSFLEGLKSDLSASKADIEKATKAQNDRAFKRLQTLLASVKIPRDGKDGQPGVPGEPGKDGSPDEPKQIRDKLETLKGEERLDASAIKNLPQFIKEKSREMLVGGIRFFENLADVSIITTNKRQNLLPQYDTTDKRWEDGVALTVSTIQPTDPKENDLWVDTN